MNHEIFIGCVYAVVGYVMLRTKSTHHSCGPSIVVVMIFITSTHDHVLTIIRSRSKQLFPEEGCK